jgi:membrane protein implicated in regulation of membrane protease activity
MSNILNILAIVAFVIFIVYNIVEIVLANRFYKKIEKEHQEEINKIIDDCIDKMVNKNDSNV